MQLLERLRRGLGATRSLLAERLGATEWQVSPEALEEVLLAADVGVEAAENLAAEFERARRRGEIEVGHSADLYVVDDRGDIVLQWPFGTSSDDLAADLQTLLA